ncbi:23S rRNA (adenine(2030)-N(6))-methyltransferase RlmJ [Brucellaceae bacterium C25G]
MNYRHAYHAGNFADVVKHIILTRILEYMKLKDAAFRVIDTHAGIGRYDLMGPEAAKTIEWKSGIFRLMEAVDNQELDAETTALIAPFIEAVKSENTSSEIRFYPGSPLLTRRLLRKQDRLSALELHPEDAKTLARLFEGDYQVRVTHLDGWLAMGAHLPPKEKRGVVLVDPPFEIGGEFDRLVSNLVKAHKKFSGGTYALWYPIKDHREVKKFHQALYDSGIQKIMSAELSIRTPSLEPRLDGTGMIIVNPPYLLEKELKLILPALVKLLCEDKGAGYRLNWIRKEGDGA